MTDKLELYFKAAQSSKIGIWKMNLETNHVYWDTVTKCIFEVSDDFEPINGSGITFNPPRSEQRLNQNASRKCYQ